MSASVRFLISVAPQRAGAGVSGRDYGSEKSCYGAWISVMRGLSRFLSRPREVPCWQSVHGALGLGGTGCRVMRV